MMLRSARRAAFTILEILIAIVVLVLGITGIIALFPTAIESGNKTVEDSYAAAITQSVVDALTVGVRESRYNTVQGGRIYTYFIFNHDGVIDQAPNTPAVYDTASGGANPKQGAIWRRDFCILLPTAAVGNTVQTLEPNFVYPVPSYVADSDETAKDSDVGLNQRNPSRLAAVGTPLVDNLDPKFQRPANAGGAMIPWYSRVYQLGRYREVQDGSPIPLPTGPGGVPMQRGDIRLEYRGDAIATGPTTTEQTISIDPYPSYSFCFTLQRARVDNCGATPGTVPDGRLTSTDSFSDTLYQLRVMIFKNFDTNAAFELRPSDPINPETPVGPELSIPRTNAPIRDFVTLIAL